MTDVPATVALEAADPTTAPARLAEIAASSPSLHGAILQNPSTYADLRQWIADYPAPAPATPPETVVLAPDRQPASSPGAATPLASGGRAVSMAAAVGGSLGLVLILVVGSAIAFAVMTSSRPAYYEYSDYDVSDPATQDEANASEGDAATGSGNNLPGDTFVVDSRIPASCDSMFSPAMRAQLEAAGLSLNPPRVVGNGSLGSRDPTIASFVQQPLVCIWADARIDTPNWLVTTVSTLRPEDSATVDALLATYTTTNSEQLGGRRYLIDEGTWGESHLIRDGIWFATAWNNVGPDGYTADLVAHVFG